jgi:hypothetical protein
MNCKANRARAERWAQKVTKPSERQTGAPPVFDCRLFGLALDSLACVQAQVASSIAGIPYGAVREATRFSEDEKAQLVEVAQKIAIKHAAAFAEHKEVVELGVAFIAIQATRLDQVLCRAAGDKPLTWKQCLVGLLIILGPLLIPLAIYLANLQVAKPRR